MDEGRKTAIASGAGGFCGVIFGYPFDSLKTRMQAFNYNSTWHCAKTTFKQEGFMGFFRGMTQPLFTVSIIKSFTFSNYESMKPIIGVTGSGFVAGFVTSIICCPLETAKIQLQLQRKNTSATNIQFKGSVDCLLKIYQKVGVRGLFHGLGLQASRDSLGSSLHFTCYEASKSMFREALFLSPELSALLAGGLSGSLAWMAVFPIDLIKTKRQNNVLVMSSWSKSSITMASEIYTQYGIRGLYSGLFPTIIRAFPIHSINFFVYETLRTYLSK